MNNHITEIPESLVKADLQKHHFIGNAMSKPPKKSTDKEIKEWTIVVRKYGTITIPKNIREALGIKSGDALKAKLEQRTIVLWKPH